MCDKLFKETVYKLNETWTVNKCYEPSKMSECCEEHEGYLYYYNMSKELFLRGSGWLSEILKLILVRHPQRNPGSN